MSQAEPVEKTIDGVKYVMYMLPPKPSYRLFIKVIKMVGPALGPVLDTALAGKSKSETTSFLDREVGPDFFSKAASRLFESLDESVLDRVVDEFAAVTEADGIFLNKTFDSHFMGSLDQMAKWLGWGMKAQWGKLLSVWVDEIKSRQPGRQTEESPSQNTSTG